jgi:hypothetical protein
VAPVPDSEHDGAKATFREMAAAVEAARREIIAEVEKIQAKVDAKFDAHAAKHEGEHKSHDEAHRREADRRTGYIRWAVTSLLTGAGVLLSIYLALRP